MIIIFSKLRCLAESAEKLPTIAHNTLINATGRGAGS
jgi:hypothetical protein